MQNIDEKIKFVRGNGEVLLKLHNKNSATYFNIWLTSRKIDYRFVAVHNEDDLFYDPEENKEDEYLFWIKTNDWNDLKDEIRWE